MCFVGVESRDAEVTRGKCNTIVKAAVGTSYETCYEKYLIYSSLYDI